MSCNALASYDPCRHGICPVLDRESQSRGIWAPHPLPSIIGYDGSISHLNPLFYIALSAIIGMLCYLPLLKCLSYIRVAQQTVTCVVSWLVYCFSNISCSLVPNTIYHSYMYVILRFGPAPNSSKWSYLALRYHIWLFIDFVLLHNFCNRNRKLKISNALPRDWARGIGLSTSAVSCQARDTKRRYECGCRKTTERWKQRNCKWGFVQDENRDSANASVKLFVPHSIVFFLDISQNVRIIYLSDPTRSLPVDAFRVNCSAIKFLD